MRNIIPFDKNLVFGYKKYIFFQQHKEIQRLFLEKEVVIIN